MMILFDNFRTIGSRLLPLCQINPQRLLIVFFILLTAVLHQSHPVSTPILHRHSQNCTRTIQTHYRRSSWLCQRRGMHTGIRLRHDRRRR